jgi:hypothetical protein
LYCLLHVFQTGSDAYQASYAMIIIALFPGVKQPEREADHSLVINAEVKKTWIYAYT